MSEVFFTSDLHGFHTNICRGVSKWDDKSCCRDFNSIEEMNGTIVKNLNDVVQSNDTLYCLGDWTFGGKDKVFKFRSMINCSNIIFIYGNHDHHIQDRTNNLQRLFSETHQYLERKIRGAHFVLFHYAIREWVHKGKGTLHLYGHSHGNLPDPGNRSTDVGVDTNNFKPYHLDEVVKFLISRPIGCEDHHASR